jgi:hypothetical protein
LLLDEPMSPARRIIVNLVLIALIAGSTYDIVTDQEHWPFSQYPMFSGAWRSPRFSWLRVFGVTADGREFPLDANRFIAPFDQSRLPKALRRILDGRDPDIRVRQALAECLARYEELRSQNRHEGPQLVALRLYELEWTIDPEAANIDRPDRRSFIAEVQP